MVNNPESGLEKLSPMQQFWENYRKNRLIFIIEALEDPLITEEEVDETLNDIETPQQYFQSSKKKHLPWNTDLHLSESDLTLIQVTRLITKAQNPNTSLQTKIQFIKEAKEIITKIVSA